MVVVMVMVTEMVAVVVMVMVAEMLALFLVR